MFNQSKRSTAPGNRSYTSETGKRVITLQMTIPTFISGIITMLLGVIWIFFLGILLGRGHSPEDAIPELNRLMPQPRSVSVAMTTPESGTSQAPQPSAAPQPQEPVRQPSSSAPMTQDDLSFHDSLKSTPRPGDTPATPNRGANTQTRSDSRTTHNRETPATQPAVERFEYRVQIAAYRLENPANALTDKMKKAGFSIITEKTMDKGKPWFKNVVTFKGTAEEFEKFKASLATHGFASTLMRTKKPIK